MASWLTTPAPMANVAFEHSSARITLSRRATAIASPMSAIGRTRLEAPGADRCCIGRRTSEKISPATTNVATSATIDALRPNAWLNNPPSPAPTASITPHVEPIRAFALRSSSSSRARFGIAASMHGLTKAASAATSPWNTNATQMRFSASRSRPDAASAWAALTTSRTFRRSSRSTTGPANGEARNDGSENETRTSDTRSSESVTSAMYPARATNTNQSPRNEITWAMNTQRRSRFVRSSAHMPSRRYEARWFAFGSRRPRANQSELPWDRGAA